MSISIEFDRRPGRAGTLPGSERRSKENLTMRKIVATEYVTVDDVMEDPGGAETFEHGGWTMPYWSDELGQLQFQTLTASDALLLGRKTYEGFAAAWPKMKDEAGFADRMNDLPKYVVTKTLDELEWNNSHALKGDVVEEVTRLKEQPGQDILIYGSATLVRTLLQHGLIDQYQLLVYPVVLGSGKRLFGDAGRSALTLEEAKAYGCGVALLRYGPATS
jgi:dihydrofolate reductase